MQGGFQPPPQQAFGANSPTGGSPPPIAAPTPGMQPGLDSLANPFGTSSGNVPPQQSLGAVTPPQSGPKLNAPTTGMQSQLKSLANPFDKQSGWKEDLAHLTGDAVRSVGDWTLQPENDIYDQRFQDLHGGLWPAVKAQMEARRWWGPETANGSPTGLPPAAYAAGALGVGALGYGGYKALQALKGKEEEPEAIKQSHFAGNAPRSMNSLIHRSGLPTLPKDAVELGNALFKRSADLFGEGKLRDIAEHDAKKNRESHSSISVENMISSDIVLGNRESFRR